MYVFLDETSLFFFLFKELLDDFTPQTAIIC